MTLGLVIQDEVTVDHAPTAAQFRLWLDTALSFVADAPTQGELTIRIISLDESAQLNESYRQKQGPTNVLSFGYDTLDPFTGDLAICADLVQQEALAQEKLVEAHWAHLVVHGVLHLMGFDHIDDNEARDMEALETTIMQQLKYTDPY